MKRLFVIIISLCSIIIVHAQTDNITRKRSENQVRSMQNSNTVSSTKATNVVNAEQPLKLTVSTAVGTVIDKSGMPIIGADIMEKGTDNSTITDIDGNFYLRLQRSPILVVSYVGFKIQEVQASENMKIVLTEK